MLNPKRDAMATLSVCIEDIGGGNDAIQEMNEENEKEKKKAGNR